MDLDCNDGSAPVLYPNECCPECGSFFCFCILNYQISHNITILVGDRNEGECEFTDWSDFGPCSVTCGEGGQRVRIRRLISVDSDGDSVNCNGNLTELQPCDPGPCICKYCTGESENTGVVACLSLRSL